MWLGIMAACIQGGLFVSLHTSVIGAIVGYLALWSVYWVFRLITDKEGMGYGDFKMLAAIGAWLGLDILPIVVLVAAVVGIIAALIKRVSQGQPMAFGPCLAVAGWFIFLFHNSAVQAFNWWLTKSGF